MGKKNTQKTISVPSQIENVENLVAELVDFVCGSTKLDAYAISLALTEALSNAIIHGNKNNRRKKIHVQVVRGQQRVTFKVADEGSGFEYKKVSDPTRAENLLKLNGRGIFLIRHLMDQIRFNRSGNEITMIKCIA